MEQFWQQFFSNDFLPHGYCIAWQPGVLWLHVVSDALITLAYYSIPIALAYFVAARKDLAFSWMFILFALFILACGSTHLMSIITLWEPAYWWSGSIKAVTAGVSLLTAALLWPLLPKALVLPSPTQLAVANRELQRQFVERATAEKALRESEAKLRALFEILPVGITILDKDRNIVDLNLALEKILAISKEELLRGDYRARKYLRHDGNLMIPAEFPSVRAFNEQGVVTNVEIGIVKEDGETIWTDVSAAPLPTADLGVVVVTTDITAHKRAEAQLRASLREKEALLQEIHHRVKNNLQIVSSLLNLQAENIKDEQTLQVLRDSQHRIRSMALIHETLYQSKDLVRVDFAQYIDQLLHHLFHSYGVKSSKIKTKVKVERVLLDLDTSIACGLIINELVSNVLKHAFPTGIDLGRKGEIRLDLRADEAQVRLTVSDNGVGFPAEVDFRQTESLGLQMVNLLIVNELEGKIALDRSSGTAFEITFPRSNHLRSEHYDPSPSSDN